MGQGKYERTPLTKARFKMSIAQRRVDKLKAEVAKAEQEKQELQTAITELEKEENE